MATHEDHSRRARSRTGRRLAVLAAVVAATAVSMLASNAFAAAAYPPQGCATLSVSTTAPLPGATFTTAGAHFAPNSSVRLELQSAGRVLATVTTDGAGSFSTNVTLPDGVTGHDELAATGRAVAGSGCSAVVAIDIGPGSTASSDGTGGGTAFTGTNVLALVIGAVALIGAGLAFTRAARRPRRASGPGR